MFPRTPIALGMACLALLSCDSGTSSPTPSPSSETPATPIEAATVIAGIDTAFSLSMNDTAHFRFWPEVGATYEFKTVGPVNTSLELKDSLNRSVLARDQAPDSTNGKLRWTADRNSPVLLSIRRMADASTLGITRLRIAKMAVPIEGPVEEANSTLHAAVAIQPDGISRTRALAAKEMEWFKVPLKKGTYYAIEAKGGKTANLEVFLADSSRASWMYETRLFFLAPEDGDFFIRLSLNDPTMSDTILLNVRPDSSTFRDVEPNASKSAAALIPANGILQDLHWTLGDVEWIQFPVDSGKRYRVDVESPIGFNLWARLDTSIQYFNLAQGTTTLAFRAPRAGTVYVNYSSRSIIAGSYRIRAGLDTANLDAYESDDTPAEAKLISTDGVVQSRYLKIGESDWLKFDADSGVGYLVDLQKLDGATVELFADGTSQRTAWGWGGAGIKAYRSGPIYIRLGGGERYNGEYGILVRPDSINDAHEPDDAPESAALLLVDSTAQQHRLQTGETDWMRFDVMPGKTYTIRMSTESKDQLNFDLFGSPSGSGLGRGYCWSGLSGSIVYKATTQTTLLLRVKPEYSWGSGPYRVLVTSESTESSP